MDRINKHDVGSSAANIPGPSHTQQMVLLPEAVDSVELGDRLLAFWHIYWHDKVFAILLGFLPALPHDDTIDSVFPRELEEYETVESSLASNAAFSGDGLHGIFLRWVLQGDVYLSRNETISTFLVRREDEESTLQSGSVDSLFTMQLKAVTLLDRASRLAQRTRSRKSTRDPHFPY